MKQSASDDAEESIISKLKIAYGLDYTRSLDIMFRDMTVSKTLIKEYDHCKIKNNKKSNINFDMQVLSNHCWPFKPPNRDDPTNFILPRELEVMVNEFMEFYETKYKNRVLKWLYSEISRGEIKANCFKQAYIFHVSTFEMAIILLFNNHLILTVDDISISTGIELDLVCNILKNMKKSGLITTDDGTGIDKNSKVELNLNFSSKKLRVKMNCSLKKVVEKKREEVYKYTEDQRKIIIQSTIIRLLKIRKTLAHLNMIEDVKAMVSQKFITVDKEIKVR